MHFYLGQTFLPSPCWGLVRTPGFSPWLLHSVAVSVFDFNQRDIKPVTCSTLCHPLTLSSPRGPHSPLHRTETPKRDLRGLAHINPASWKLMTEGRVKWSLSPPPPHHPYLHPGTFQEEAMLKTLLDNREAWEIAWEGIGTHSTMPQILCSALERETFPSLLPGHTHVPLFP